MSPCKLFSNSATALIIRRRGFPSIRFSTPLFMLWLFRFFSVWPLAVLQALGGALGWLVWSLSPRYRAHFRANVAQAGLPFDAARPAIAQAGRFVAELPRLWLRPPGQSPAHSGCFELGPQALAELYGPAHGPLTAMYRPARKAWLAELEQMARNRRNLGMVPASLSGIRLMHKALKQNRAVGLLADQVPPEGLGLWAPFLGKPAYTMTLAARLAMQSGAALLPVSCERLPRGRGYALKIWPPVAGLESAEKGGLLEAVTRINQAVEAIVLRQPGQYLWGYARYKTPRKESD
jgi:KDO2-lipid IV(A) lauroyltransferase